MEAFCEDRPAPFWCGNSFKVKAPRLLQIVISFHCISFPTLGVPPHCLRLCFSGYCSSCFLPYLPEFSKISMLFRVLNMINHIILKLSGNQPLAFKINSTAKPVSHLPLIFFAFFSLWLVGNNIGLVLRFQKLKLHDGW